MSKLSGVTVDLSAYTPTREGYHFEGWYSGQALTKAVSSIKLTDNTTVYAKWKETSTNPFSHVSREAYYYDAVLWAVGKGITKGTTDAIFAPNVTCTRA